MPVARHVVPATALAGVLIAGAGCGTVSPWPDAGAVATPSAGVRSAELPRATTYTRVPAASRDTAPTAASDGVVLHPTRPAVVYAAPGGRAVAVLPTTQLGSPTWVPVVNRSGEWRKILLPSRPNHSTGWVHTGEGPTAAFDERRTGSVVRIGLAARTLEISTAGRVTGRWPVAVGDRDTPTPAGRSFLLALLAPEKGPSPLVLPLGVHSPALERYEDGPATIALHGWHDRAVFGRAVSHGCVRVPADALRRLARLPLGTLVLIGQ